MKKLHLIPALTIAALAVGTLSLPATASADTFKYQETLVVRGAQPRDVDIRPVHANGRRHYESRHHWTPPSPRYDRGHHYGHQHRYVERRPVVRYEPRYDNRPVERYESRPDGDVRVRISYDLHL